MPLPGIFKKAAKLKKKEGKAEEGAELQDQSIYRIGVYGHKGVGKTVYFTIAYACSKQSPDFELMALGETQEILEEKYNLMRGQGMDTGTGQRLISRRFPPLSTGEQKLDFEIRVGKSTVVPVNTIDYSGELIYIDARGDIKQNLINFFKNCECVLFFMDPEAIKNEGERSNRIAAFTDLIGQLSGPEKRLKIPVGLVVTKSDELSGFKSAEQSIMIGKGSGYIRALNFAGLLRGVLKQRNITARPEWKSELESMLNRLESFFKPLLNRTMDYQVFFVSSTGNSPEVVADGSGGKIKIPPEDLRPLGVSHPLRWAISRIAAYRRAIAFASVLKWTFLLIALLIDLVAFGHIYNQMQIRELYRKVSGEPRTLQGADASIARYYRYYANNPVVRTFFSDFSQKATEEYKYFSNVGSRQAQKSQQERFKRLTDSADAMLAGLAALRADSAKYDSALASVKGLLDSAEIIANSVADVAQKSQMMTEVTSRRGQLQNVPTGGQVTAAQNLKDKYDALVTEFNENLAALNYDYLLGMGPDQFPAKLKGFKDQVLATDPNNPLATNYSRRIQSYLTAISTNFQTGVLIPFKIEGAEGGENGYSILFAGADEAPQGDIDKTRTDLFIRVPVVSTQQFSIDVRKGGSAVLQSYPVNAGYAILKLNGERIKFVDPTINIRLVFELDRSFFQYFKNKL